MIRRSRKRFRNRTEFILVLLIALSMIANMLITA